MKVSHILQSRDRLRQTLQLTEHNSAFENYFQSVFSAFVDISFLRDKFESTIQSNATQWRSATTVIENNLSLGIEECNRLIVEHETPLFDVSRKFYADMYHNETDFVTLTRSLGAPDKLYDEIFTRIGKYSSWEYPALLIRPGNETVVERLVASDPLYLMDQRLSLLQPSLDKFPPEYQRRLRTYTVEEGYRLMDHLPSRQFNLVVAYNFLNYRPIDVLQQYITEVFEKLRPGGIFGFTFNDCEHVAPTQLAENSFACYTPGRLVLSHAQHTGFQVISQDSDGHHFHWLELQKPGTLSTLRGGQTLAKILPKY